MSLSHQTLSFQEIKGLFLRLASLIVAPDPSHTCPLLTKSSYRLLLNESPSHIISTVDKVGEIDWGRVVKGLENLV